MKTATAVAACLLLSACSMTLGVHGVVVNSHETFDGEATGYTDGSGNMVIKTQRGVTCTGKFVYVTHRQGAGTLQCDDGRAGSFSFVSTGDSGTGTGKIGDEEFVFTFG